MTELDQFLSCPTTPNRGYVRDRNFPVLYIRRSRRIVWIDGEGYDFPDLFQISRIEAAKPGTGAFTRLFNNHKNRPIFIESLVGEPYFRHKLERLGFQHVNKDNHSVDYLWVPRDLDLESYKLRS